VHASNWAPSPPSSQTLSPANWHSSVQALAGLNGGGGAWGLTIGERGGDVGGGGDGGV